MMERVCARERKWGKEGLGVQGMRSMRAMAFSRKGRGLRTGNWAGVYIEIGDALGTGVGM